MAEFVEYTLPDEYDPVIEQLIGRLVLLYGQTDRMLAEAIRKKSNSAIDPAKAIALVRGHRNGRGLLLGQWSGKLDEAAQDYNLPIEWAEEVKRHIAIIKPMRDQIIHDTLMLSPKDELEWRTNQSRGFDRKHKNFDMAEIKTALKDIYAFKQFIGA